LLVLLGQRAGTNRSRAPALHYLKADDYTPEELANAVAQRIRSNRQQPARDVGVIVQEAMQYRMPNLVPQTFSKYRELEVV
jgi:hypothetical protein